MTIAITPTEEVGTYGPVEVGKDRPVTFQVIGTLAGVESIDFQVEATYNETTKVSTWRDMKINDTDVKISATNDIVTFYGPTYVKAAKSASAGAVGLRIVNQ